MSDRAIDKQSAKRGGVSACCLCHCAMRVVRDECGSMCAAGAVRPQHSACATPRAPAPGGSRPTPEAAPPTASALPKLRHCRRPAPAISDRGHQHRCVRPGFPHQGRVRAHEPRMEFEPRPSRLLSGCSAKSGSNRRQPHALQRQKAGRYCCVDRSMGGKLAQLVSDMFEPARHVSNL